jgi:hypothetical protein
MSILTAVAIIVLVPAAYLLFAGVAYWLGSLPRRGEFNELRKEVNELRKEIRETQYRTARSR